MRILQLALLLLLLVTNIGAGRLPSPTVPGGLGVNIHFTDEQGYQDQLTDIKAGGFGVIRMDMDITNVEKSPGVYNFTAYDNLIAACQARGIRPMLTLDDSASGPYNSPAFVQDFTAFATAAAAHYKQQGVIWELWNEPAGIGGIPNPNDYMTLANSVLPAIRQADSSATILAPGLLGPTYDPSYTSYLTTCFNQGLLNEVDGISVHFYRNSSPETAVSDNATVRSLISSYGSHVPVVSGEWGYSSYSGGVSAQTQGDYLARSFLVNLSQGVPLSIWYDWADGSNPDDPEQNFGVVSWWGTPPIPKPAFTEMQALTHALSGEQYSERLSSSSSDWLLVFIGPNGRHTLAAWTTGASHNLFVPGYGQLFLTGTPIYVAPEPATIGMGIVAFASLYFVRRASVRKRQRHDQRLVNSSINTLDTRITPM